MSATAGVVEGGGAAGQVRPSRPGRGRRRRFVDLLPPILVFIGVLVFWEVSVTVLDLKAFLFPRPTAIGRALVDNWSGGTYAMFPSWQATMLEAVGGLVIGTIAGVAVALVTARWISARDALLPLAIAAGAVPIVAFAPLMNNWFGTLSPVSKMMMAAALVFFPVMVNVSRGLTQVDASALELMRSYAASDWVVLRKVRIPNALPFFFTALKLATTLSLIGAIVGEYFGGSPLVLGRLIVQGSSALRFDITWAAVVTAAVTGIVLYLAVVAIERIVMPWHASLRSSEP
jgi:NitT/TauT family transport system permease protein